MHSTLRYVAILVAAGLVAGCGGNAGSYSAEQVTKDPDGRAQLAARVYAAPGKLRVEQLGRDGAPAMVAIYRKDLGVVRMLAPGQKTCLELKFDEAEFAKTIQAVPVNATMEEFGTEFISGYECKKRRVKTTTRALMIARTTETLVWTSALFDLPLRTQQQNGSVTELQGIRTGRQPDELFEVPAGYQTRGNPLEALLPSHR